VRAHLSHPCRRLAPTSCSPAPPRTHAGGKPSYNFEGEQMYYEGPPHRGDLAVNLALGITL